MPVSKTPDGHRRVGGIRRHPATAKPDNHSLNDVVPEGLLRLQRMAGNRATTRLVDQLDVSDSKSAIQRAVSPSASYGLGGGRVALVAALEAQLGGLAGAEAAAVNAVTVGGGGVDTPTVAAYKINNTSMAWGSVIEEQLNLVAPAAWDQQYPLGPGSRPDYHQTVGGTELFVDLTTPAQAALGGNHITQKLNRVGSPLANPNWEAADITYATAPPHLGGALAALVPNGVLVMAHVALVQAYNQALDPNGMDYLDWAQTLREQGYPHHISVPTFTQLWTAAQRLTFYNTALDIVANPQNYHPADYDDEF